MTSKEVVDLCNSIGIGASSPSSSMVEAQADRVRRHAEEKGLKREPAADKPKKAKKAADDTAEPKEKKAPARAKTAAVTAATSATGMTDGSLCGRRRSRGMPGRERPATGITARRVVAPRCQHHVSSADTAPDRRTTRYASAWCITKRPTRCACWRPHDSTAAWRQSRSTAACSPPRWWW
ncbi:MAG: hypothetical protein EBW27_01440 [Acidimicrobiia bacterium]|nr:hypothetical protein [Acidimicrobiia bacterium]